MTHVAVQVGAATAAGECKLMQVVQPYPSNADPSVVALYITIQDPAQVCALMEALGDVCQAREDYVPGVSAVVRRVDRGPGVGSRAAMIEQVRKQLDGERDYLPIPSDWIRALLAEYDLQRARADIAEAKREK